MLKSLLDVLDKLSIGEVVGDEQEYAALMATIDTALKKAEEFDRNLQRLCDALEISDL